MTVDGPTFYSSRDEDHFFSWLASIPGVTRIVGEGRSLHVTLRSSHPGEDALRDLIALHWRYRLSMRHLAAFRSPSNEHWFEVRGMYWYDAVFGAAA